MKKLNRFAALAAIILLLVMGCKVEPDAIAVESVSLSEKTLTLEPAMIRRLTATVTPDNADDKTVKWSSSNPNVAPVDSSGMIAAFKEGTAIITAQAGDKTAMCIVTVKSEVAVESITLSETTLTLTPDMTKRLTATVTPSNADDKTVSWTSSNTSIATVDNYGTVRAYAEGTTTITAQAGDKTATCTVTVKSSLTAVKSVSLNTTTLTIEPGATMMLTATVTPSNADDKTVKWSSSNNVIAMVDNNGTVSAHAEGTATITAQAGDKMAKCTVTVHFHIYSEGKCTKCGAVQDFNGTIDENGVLTDYWGNESSVTLPDSVTSIGDYAFEHCCTSLASVKIPTSVTSIGDRAFEYCTSLAEIQFEGTKAQWKAIEGSDNVAVACVRCRDGNIDNPKYLVTSVTLNTTTLPIEPGTTEMLTATVTPSNAGATVTWSSSNNDIAMVYNDGTVMAYAEGTATITAQAGDKTTTCTVTVHFHSYSGGKCTVCGAVQDFNGTIDENGVLTHYWGNESSVTIPDSVTSIGDSAFSNCTSLTSVTIPDGVTTIEHEAFGGCTSLTSVTIPDGVTTIGDGAFKDCTSLENVTIPNSVTSIGNWAFDYCTSLAEIQFKGTKAQWKAIKGRDKLYIYILCSDGHIGVKEVPEYLTMHGSTVVTGYTSGVPENLVIPDGVTSIENGTIDFYGNVKGAFCNCTSLTSVTIPDSVDSIGDWAFYGCTSLESVTIPNSVTRIGHDAFNYCTNLDSVIFSGTKERWDQIVGNSEMRGYDMVQCTNGYWLNPYYWKIENGVLKGYFGNKTTVVIPDCVTSIEDGTNNISNNHEGVFSNRTRLESVTIPNSVTRIGDYAFYSCYSLTSVTLPKSVTRIGREAFAKCSKLTSVTYNGTLADWCAIDFSVESNPLSNKNVILYIKNSPVTDVQIPNNVTEIKDYAFAEYTSLLSVTIPDSVTRIGHDAFNYCTNLTNVTIGNGVTSIGYQAFFRCRSLSSMTIPDSVTSIGDWAFAGCTSLTNVTIPDGVTSINISTFEGCTSLESVTIPNSVTRIGSQAFNCEKLKDITYNGTREEWNKIDRSIIANKYFDGLSGKTITGKDANGKQTTWTAK